MAGGTFTAKVALRRSDGGSLATARVGCGARVAGRALRVVPHEVANRVATCTWALPAWSGGKRITGTVRVTAGGLVTRRAFRAKVGCSPAASARRSPRKAQALNAARSSSATPNETPAGAGWPATKSRPVSSSRVTGFSRATVCSHPSSSASRT